MSGPRVADARIVVTGVAGFIGYHVARGLLEAGARVTGFDSMSSYYDVALKEARIRELAPNTAFSFEQLDLVDYDRVRALFERTAPHYVVHLAAQAGVRQSLLTPRPFVSANVDGFLSILEACRARPVHHLVYASSSSVYGANTKVPFHEDDPVLAPISLYAATKRANELMAQTYAHLYRIECSGLRFFTVYGPWGRPDMAYYMFTKAIDEGRPIDVYNHGRMRRDLTYVDDVTQAIVRLLERPPSLARPQFAESGRAPHELYNIGNHTPVELERFIGAIEAALGKQALKRYLPMQPGDVPETYADVSRLAAVTGFAPSTPIEEGIDRFVAWYRAYHGRA
jgi:UDP-glucuronate 4-epimerase